MILLFKSTILLFIFYFSYLFSVPLFFLPTFGFCGFFYGYITNIIFVSLSVLPVFIFCGCFRVYIIHSCHRLFSGNIILLHGIGTLEESIYFHFPPPILDIGVRYFTFHMLTTKYLVITLALVNYPLKMI